MRRPTCTATVCCPSKVASRTTSRHQKVTFIIIPKNPIKNTSSPRENPCLYLTSPKVMNRAENPV
jgi:hypothetical protein